MIELIFVVVCLGIIVRQHLKIRELKSDNEDLEYKLGKLSTNTKHINDLDSALMLGKLSAMGRSAERKRGWRHHKYGWSWSDSSSSSSSSDSSSSSSSSSSGGGD